MLATGLLSMWISNTATSLMMVTIGTAIISQTSTRLPADSSFFKALLLGIAYAASIGGVATLVGTPTNPIFVAIANELYQQDISFLSWMSFGLPFSLLLIFLVWLYLSRYYRLSTIDLSMGKELIHQELKALGPISFEEKAVAWVFGFTALAWITRTFLLAQLVPGINDTSIAIAGAITLFLIPARKAKESMILNWAEAVKLPWGVILLFGGGLSIAAAFRSSGLAEWIGTQMATFEGLPTLVVILIVALIVNFLTEVTSNVATASIILPVLAALSEAIGIHPFLLMIPATMAASCAFMLPVATAPNAIVFASGKLRVSDMAKAGFILNLLSTTLISLIGYYLLDFVFGF
jgi:sodium-dependent dicarboxylate transporter 2/3/5